MGGKWANTAEIIGALNLPQRDTAVNYVVDSIIELIRGKKLQPGDRLPAEPELCSLLNVSRGSMREAMRILSVYGLVEVKRGDGTYVSNSEDSISWDPLFLKFMLIAPSETEMIELRNALERVLLTIAIQHATQEDIEDIRMAHYAMKIAVEKRESSFDELAKMDIDFHLTVSKATHNRMLNSIYCCIMNYFYPYVHKSLQVLENYGKQAVKTHEAALSAIETRDYEACEKAGGYIVNVWESLVFTRDNDE